MNRTTIEFADFTWNPIVGCKFGCPYCWARKFHRRYFCGDFTAPVFHAERMNDKVPRMPKNRNYIARAISPDKPVVFVCDMGDFFSAGVEWWWQRAVLTFIHAHQEANFILLTKNPSGFSDFVNDIPGNVICGTSLDYAHNLYRVEGLKCYAPPWCRTFVNIEPIMSMMKHVDFSGIDFVVVGALSGAKYRPDPEWHRSINHPIIHYKRNYIEYFPELKLHQPILPRTS